MINTERISNPTLQLIIKPISSRGKIVLNSHLYPRRKIRVFWVCYCFEEARAIMNKFQNICFDQNNGFVCFSIVTTLTLRVAQPFIEPPTNPHSKNLLRVKKGNWLCVKKGRKSLYTLQPFNKVCLFKTESFSLRYSIH